MQRADKKIVWLTGASSGIGAALVKKFLTEEYVVIASSRSLNALADYQDQIIFIQLDATKSDSIKECIGKIEQDYGRIDIAILNAGVCEYVEYPEFSLSTIEHNFSVNFFGMVRCIDAALPLLRNSSTPQLIGMSSSAVYMPFARAEGYGASKAAGMYLLRSLQAHADDINISIICPGFVKTPLTDKNNFPMPFLISSEKAANLIFKGIRKKKPVIEFPWQLIFILKILHLLPYRLQNVILKQLGKYQ